MDIVVKGAPKPKTLENWSQVTTAFDAFPPPKHELDSDGEIRRTRWVFRGHQHDEYNLEPLIERDKAAKWPIVESKSLAEFQAKAQLHIDVTHLQPVWEEKLNWLSLMQHHGVPTRLLDFTHSPYAALYFALRHHPEPCKAAEVWAIDAEALTKEANRVSGEADREENDYWTKWDSGGRRTVPGPGPTSSWSGSKLGRLGKRSSAASLNPAMFLTEQDQWEDDRQRLARPFRAP